MSYSGVASCRITALARELSKVSENLIIIFDDDDDDDDDDDEQEEDEKEMSLKLTSHNTIF